MHVLACVWFLQNVLLCSCDCIRGCVAQIQQCNFCRFYEKKRYLNHQTGPLTYLQGCFLLQKCPSNVVTIPVTDENPLLSVVTPSVFFNLPTISHAPTNRHSSVTDLPSVPTECPPPANDAHETEWGPLF